jgi:hypothetical protein
MPAHHYRYLNFNKIASIASDAFSDLANLLSL